MVAPIHYVHDCNSCIFLGNVFDVGVRQVTDVYYCPKCRDGTLIIRYSDEGHDYLSYPLAIVGDFLHLQRWADAYQLYKDWEERHNVISDPIEAAKVITEHYEDLIHEAEFGDGDI
jgi:hypothetical protein